MKAPRLPTPYDVDIAELTRRLRLLKRRAREHRLAQRQCARWADPEYRQRMLSKMRSPEQRQKTAETARASCSTPEERAERSARLKAQWADPAMRERMRSGLRAMHKARKEVTQQQARG